MIEIYADYQLSEYLTVLTEAVPIIAVYKKTGSWPSEKQKLGIGTKMLIYLVAPISFFIKKRIVGACSFELSEDGILRRSKSGESSFTNSEIECIHVLSNAYLVWVGRGAMPLPYRCFERQQKERFEEMLTQKLRSYG